MTPERLEFIERCIESGTALDPSTTAELARAVRELMPRERPEEFDQAKDIIDRLAAHRRSIVDRLFALQGRGR